MPDSSDLIQEITDFLEKVSHTSIPEQIRAGRWPPRSRLGHLPWRRPSLWLLAATMVMAFTAGGLALALRAWWLAGLCAAVAVAAAPVGKVLGFMDAAGASRATRVRPRGAAGRGRHTRGRQSFPGAARARRQDFPPSSMR